MPRPGRKSTSKNTHLVQLTLPNEVDTALERLKNTGIYGRSKSEVVVNLLSREFERIARDGLVASLGKLSK